MPVRYPPNNQIPPVRSTRETRKTRLVAYAEPEKSLSRRILRRLFSAPVVIPVVFLGAIVFGVLIYYWTVFSGRIDNLLKGEVFTRSAGIYAAPKQIHVGQAISQDQLLELLKGSGYVEKAQQADKARGRYTVSNGMVEIEPSDSNVVDGQRQF